MMRCGRQTRRWLAPWVILLPLLMISGCGDQEKDDVDDSANGEPDDNLTDDDATPDESDDDTAPPATIYDELEPTGPMLAEEIGLATQMDADPAAEWKRDFEVATLKGIGARNIRKGFSWEDIEPENDVWTWEATDLMRDYARDEGIRFNARLAYTVSWAAPGGSPSEIDPADFADYAAHVASRYCADITRYEIWNEPNFAAFWEPEPDPAHYGDLLRAAYAAIKEVCPEAEVLFGGLANSNFPQELNSGTYPFFTRVAEAHPDICDHFDGMAIHPYSMIQFFPPEFQTEIFWVEIPDLPGQARDIRRRLDEAGCGGKPLHFTEIGWPSTYIRVRRQAQYIVRALLLAASLDVQSVYLYTFWDKQGREPPTENDFGLYKFPRSANPARQVPKPSFYAYKNLLDLLGDTQFAGDLSAALGLPEQVYALAFIAADQSRIVVAAWDGRGEGSTAPLLLPWPNGAETANRIGLFGYRLPEAPEEPLHLTLTGEVQYVEFLPRNDT